jgi:hypothetical protein
MIELLAIQAITTAALAAVVIKLRRELWPAVATAGPQNLGFWIRSVDVMALGAPQFDVDKIVVRMRWTLTEELFLIHKLRIYDVAMYPSVRHHYVRWKAWTQGDTKYDCRVKKPRGLSKLYNKAVDVFCKEKKEEPPKEVIILPSKVRKRRYKRMLRQLREDAARRNSAEKST